MLGLTYKGPQQPAPTATETSCVVFVVLLFHNQAYYFSFIILTLYVQTLFDSSHQLGPNHVSVILSHRRDNITSV